MTDTAITAIFAAGMAALVSLIAGLPVLLVSITNLKQSREAAREAAQASAQASLNAQASKARAESIIVRTDEIHTLANDNLSKVTAALALANEKITGLEKLLVSMSHKKANGGEEA